MTDAANNQKKSAQGKGGFRPGAGRRKGSKNKRTLLREEVQLKTLETAVAAGITPLKAMIDVLGEAYADRGKARIVWEKDAEELEAARLRHEPQTVLDALAERERASRHTLQWHEGRLKGMSDSAAPYVHGKIQNIDLTATGSIEVVRAVFRLDDGKEADHPAE